MIDPNNPPRWWTVDEANAALPRVADAITRLQGNLAEHSNEVAVASSGNGHTPPGGLVTSPDVILELEAEAIVVRDLRTGLLDFCARSSSGRAYLLCWVPGEPEIAWWHWPEDGFAGRTPLTEPPS